VSEPAPRREYLGLVFRGLRKELDQRGLTDRVLAHLQGDAREALRNPPLHATWVPAAPYDQIILAIARETNRKTLRDVGYELSRGTAGPVALPLVKTFLNLLGLTPPSLLKNMNRITSLQIRGLHFSYEEAAPRSSVMTLVHSEPVDPLLFAPWEGAFSFGRDIFSMPFHVDTAVPDPDGRSAKIRVSW
jgi:hypothetical protein